MKFIDLQALNQLKAITIDVSKRRCKNFHAKGDLPFVLYFDFKITVPTDNIFDPEQKKNIVVSYVLIVAFHPALNLNRIIIQRSYSYCLE